MKGLIILNKPGGITSFGAVAAVRKLTGEKRVGHCGTLDPLASGVLPVFIGRPCALQQYLSNGDKEYIASLKLGVTTDSYDITGNILSKTAVKIQKEEFLKVLPSFCGEIMQTPPIFSAKSVGGVRLYKLARQGKTAEVTPCKVNIKKIELLEFSGDTARIRVECSKGTYIRSLVNDIGAALSCGAVMTELIRTKSAGFDIKEAVELNELNNRNIFEHVISEETAFLNLPECAVTFKQALRFYNGGELDLNKIQNRRFADGENIRVKYGELFVGLGKATEDAIIPLCPINEPHDTQSPKAVALGTFDGLHIAHKKVLAAAVQEGFVPCAVIFDIPPKQQEAPQLLLPPDQKISLLKKAGIKEIFTLNFNRVKDMPPQEFLQSLKNYGNVKKICCGYNYRFGKGAKGDIALLSSFCEQEGIVLSVCKNQQIDGKTVSSSAIREYVKKGDMTAAAKMLSHDFYIKGRVIHGNGRGKKIGFPTINLRYDKRIVMPKQGVYATVCEINGREFASITNIGCRPTFGKGQITCETHLPGFEGELYGKTVKLSFTEYIREEIKFKNAKELSDQINNDLKHIEKYL